MNALQRKPRREQISVTLPSALKEAVARAAADENRTISNQVRHIVALALADRQQASTSGGRP
jgi:hypothetical protein